MPVFKYVKSQKEPNDLDFYFANWRANNLSIKLKKSTSILKIKYFDEDEKLIIPVLKKISNAYQEYSGKNEERNIELEKKYLSNQISKYKVKSNNSIKEAQEYAMKENLLFNNSELLENLLNQKEGSQSISSSINKEQLNKKFGKLITDNLSNNKQINSNQLLANVNFDNAWFQPLNNISMENIRVRSANQIKNIDLQIKKIEELGNDSKKLQFIGFTIPGLVKEVYLNY